MARESREVWAKRVERWLDSGLTAREFSAETGLNPNTLAHWKWQLGFEEERQKREERRQKRRIPRKEDAPRFIEVVTAPVVESPPTPAPCTVAASPAAVSPAAASDDEPLEVILRDGLRIRVPVRFHDETLRRLVAALAGAP